MADVGAFTRYKSFGDFQEAAKKNSLAEALTMAQIQKATNPELQKQNLPAPIQIANQMLEYRNIALDTSLDTATRKDAETKFNILGQVAKTYGFDRGFEYNLTGGGLAHQTPPRGNPLGADGVPLPPLPSNSPRVPSGSMNGNTADATISLFGEGNATGTNGAAPPPFRQTLANAPAPTVGITPGFSQATSSIAADKKRAETQAQKDVELGMNPLIASAETAAKSDAGYLTEGRQKLPKLQRTLQAKELINQSLDEKMNSIAARASGFTTGFGGSILSMAPGSPAYDLRKDVDTLLANAGFDRLQEMRDNSPTGGALGQVAVVELQMLQSAAQALYASQSKEQFLTNLQAFKEQRAASLDNIRAAYEQDYKRFGGAGDPYLPAPAEPKKPIDKRREAFEAKKAAGLTPAEQEELNQLRARFKK